MLGAAFLILENYVKILAFFKKIFASQRAKITIAANKDNVGVSKFILTVV